MGKQQGKEGRSMHLVWTTHGGKRLSVPAEEWAVQLPFSSKAHVPGLAQPR